MKASIKKNKANDMKTKNLLILFFLIAPYTMLFGQHPSDLKQASRHVAIIGKSTDEGVQLRWAPTKFSVWQIASAKGWILERSEWNESDWPFELGKQSFSLLAQIPALKMEEWEKQTNINNPVVAVAAQALFGNEATKALPVGGFAGLRLAAEQQENRHAMAMLAADLSADAAKGLGLSFYDKNLKSGTNYIYRIRLENNKEGFGADTAYFYIPFDGVSPVLPPVQSVMTEGKNGSIDLIWDKSFNSQLFTAFYVERSIDGKTFIRLNELPVTSAVGEDQPDAHVFSDKDVAIGKKFFYRVIGITPFAEQSPPSEVVLGIARDFDAPLPPQKVTVEQLNNQFNISWEIDPGLIVPDATGWRVRRSINATGPYQDIHEKVLPLKQRKFVDESPVPILTNYYRLYAIDTAFNENPSMIYAAVWVDSIPPAAPVNLSALADTNGIVTVIWSENTEIDLMGYRVFVRDDAKKEWYQLTQRPITENFLIDTVDLKSLEKTIEYTVIATDFHYNVSPYAKTFRLKLPDIVPPSAPRWNNWQTIEDKIELSWFESPANDVKAHRLMKKETGGEWKLLQDFARGITKYLDIIGETSNLRYALAAVDSTGNVSDTVFLSNITSTWEAKIQKPTKVTVKYIKEDKAFQIQWDYTAAENTAIVIYRKNTDGEETEFVGSFDAQSKKCIDKGPTAFGQGYSYFIKAVASNGRESDWSGPHEVKLK
jgi:uncharacterized protein